MLEIIVEILGDIFSEGINAFLKNPKGRLWVKILVASIVCLPFAVLFVCLCINPFKRGDSFSGYLLLACSALFVILYIIGLVTVFRNHFKER